MNQPNFYAVIPATVRYCEALMPAAKLLYGEITALCSERGHCWASNSYFAGLYGVSEFTVSRWISLLEQHGFVRVKIDKVGGNQRFIYINDAVPLLRKSARGLAEKRKTLLTKSARPIDEKRKQSNTVIITESTTVSVSAHENQNQDFEEQKNEKSPPVAAHPPAAPSADAVPLLFADSEWAGASPDVWRVALTAYAPETSVADLDYYWLRCRDWSAQGGHKSVNWLATAAAFVAGDRKKGALKTSLKPSNHGQQPIIDTARIRERARRTAERLGV